MEALEESDPAVVQIVDNFEPIEEQQLEAPPALPPRPEVIPGYTSNAEYDGAAGE